VFQAAALEGMAQARVLEALCTRRLFKMHSTRGATPPPPGSEQQPDGLAEGARRRQPWLPAWALASRAASRLAALHEPPQRIRSRRNCGSYRSRHRMPEWAAMLPHSPRPPLLRVRAAAAFGSAHVWVAIRAAAVEDEVRELLGEARALYKKKGGVVPCQVRRGRGRAGAGWGGAGGH
jgi:hypothetical protein